MTETDSERVSRCVRFPAAQGRGDELAELLVAAAGTLTATPACEQYLIHRAVDGDAVWVTEVWRTRGDLDASIPDGGHDDVARAMAMLDGTPELPELRPVGGIALAEAAR